MGVLAAQLGVLAGRSRVLAQLGVLAARARRSPRLGARVGVLACARASSALELAWESSPLELEGVLACAWESSPLELGGVLACAWESSPCSSVLAGESSPVLEGVLAGESSAVAGK